MDKTPKNESTIKDEIKNRYGSIARTSGSCCSLEPSCGCSSASDASKNIGYSDDDLSAAPDGANLGLGCGNPIAIASLRDGETVLDLGSGAGFDAFLAAKKVGTNGRVVTGVEFPNSAGIFFPKSLKSISGNCNLTIRS